MVDAQHSSRAGTAGTSSCVAARRTETAGRTPVPVRGGAHMTRGGSNRLLTVEEVAAWLRVSEATVRNKYRAWGIRPQKVGRLLRFRERDIANYLEKHYG
ncbi:helix-turn-helix domain-containing protein [Streptomyces albulus]|nr:helix-turn-helix domain-containing protein [Streptomyces noursei]